MSTTEIATTHTSDRDRARRAVTPVAVGVVAVAAACTALGVFPDSAGHEAHHASEFWGVMLVVLVATLAVFGIVVPRGLAKESARLRGSVMGVIGALILLPAFWAGVPWCLGRLGRCSGMPASGPPGEAAGRWRPTSSERSCAWAMWPCMPGTS